MDDLAALQSLGTELPSLRAGPMPDRGWRADKVVDAMLRLLRFAPTCSIASACRPLVGAGRFFAFSHFMNQIDLTALSLPGVEVHDSGVHGLGAFASQDLPVGTKLGQYAGRRYSAEEAETVDWDSSLTYLFGLSDGTLIDGADGGNATRHLNHACEPNCEAVEVQRKGRRIVLEVRTIKPVRAGDELFIDYALTVDASEPRDGYPCYCKSTACRGTLLGPV